MKQTRHSLLTSATALLLCFVMLIGTTFAWFTDEVTSSSNVIQTGSLKIEMDWAKKQDGPWLNAEFAYNEPIFNYDKWEPGYTEVRYIKVLNTGNLSFKYEMFINPTGEVGILADVIDVSWDIVTNNAEFKAPSAQDKNGSLKKVGTLANLIDTNKAAAGGVLLPKGETAENYYSGEIVICVAFHMQETAGNEYQNQSIGDAFGINLYATQFDYEKDSFDNSYDDKAEWPEIPSAGNSASTSGNLETDAEGRLTSPATINGEGMSALVPAGTKLASGANKLTLSVAPKDKSDANVTLGENEELRALDVHITGVAKDNDTPIEVTLTEALPTGLNIGNYKLHHVENGQTVEMTLLLDGAIPVHNDFTYDPATGDVTLYMATFSEVAFAAKPSKWEGNFDYNWYDASKSEFVIANADQLAAFGAIVGGMKKVTGREDNKYTYSEEVIQDSFAGKTVKLIADINIGDTNEYYDDASENGIVFYPIGYWNNEGTYERKPLEERTTAVDSGLRNFEGTFDGNGHTIANFYHNTWEMKGDHNWYSAITEQYYRDGMGLFGRVYKGTVKNLTVRNFKSDGEIATTGVIAAYADGATFENIAIFGCNPRVYNIGNGGIVGCVGWYAKEANLKTTFTNITVDNSNIISALWGSYDVACGGIVGQYYPTSGQSSYDYPVNAGIHFDNCHISAQMDVYNDVCANYQYYAYRYTGMLIGSVRENETINGHSYPKMDGITASGCTVHFGTWNDYYYCEFEKNGHPSYSGPNDYKFSRIPHSEIYFTDSNGNGIIDTDGERASVTGCKHDHSDVEDNRAIYLPFDQLFTGYGWGVTSKGIKDVENIVDENGKKILDITILDREVADSKVKFEANNIKDKYMNGKPILIGELFKKAEIDDDKLDILSPSVTVTVSPADENSTVTGEYVANTTDWTQGTLTLSGTGMATITITDYYFCTATTINVEVTERQPEEKFDVVMNNGDFLHRVGNVGTVPLDKLFKAKDGVTVGTVSVTIETIDGTAVSGTYSNNAIQFIGTGVVKVTIKDDDTYCTPTVLFLEVVDATNVTGLGGELTGNVVLLNDCNLNSLTVSGRNTVFGNGFTATYSGDGRYLNNGLKQGVITVTDNGTLDNLRVVASIYPYMAFSYNDVQKTAPKEIDGTKTRYYYQLSAVKASGYATISNCYIYGGRTNIFVDTGNVTVKDTVLECGVAANSQIISTSAYTVTFENVTTIQYLVKPTVGTDSEKANNNMLGFGILVGEPDTDYTPTNPKLVLKGFFKQYNWASQNEYDGTSHSYSGYAKQAIHAALNSTNYKRTINGSDYVNMGIVYLNDEDTTIINQTGLDYLDPSSITIGILTGKVYSLSKNASESQVYFDHAIADRSTVNGLYQPQFKYDSTLGGQHIAEGGDEHFYREGDTIKVMFVSGDTKNINLAALVNIAKYSGQNLSLVITCKDSQGNNVNVTNGQIALSTAGDYTVTYTVTDTLFYDKNGNTVEGTKTYSWNTTISVSLMDKSVPNAYYEFDSSKQVMGYSGYSGNYSQFIPFLAGLKIYDYNGQNAYLRFNGDTDYAKVAKIDLTASSTESNHYLITVTLTDGGVITLHTLARADSGGSKYTGSIKVRNNVIYYVNDGTTSASNTTWTIDYYKFIGNNGVEINSGAIKFTSASATKPSSSFNTKINYTVTYNANGGDCGQTLGYATSAATAVTLPTPTRFGHTFMGWYTDPQNGTRVGGAGENYTPSANVTLYAQWGKPSTVTYDANGGSCGIASEEFDGKTLILPEATRSGYTFLGWYTLPEGGERVGTANEGYNPKGDITLYAHWQLPITVTYNANGGSCGISSELYDGDLKLPSPTRTGYKFLGWYTSATGGTKIGDADAEYIPSSNITLYAQWEQISYTITISSQNNATVTVDKNSAHYKDTVTVTVQFSEANSKSLIVKDASGTQLYKWETAGTYTFEMPASNVTIEASSTGCVTPDTLITLADGSQVRVDSLKGDEMLLVWNMETGRLDYAPIMFVDSDPEAEFEVIKLYFSDGTEVKVIAEHGFWDYDLNKYVYLDRNAADYIGHSFAKQNGDKLEKVTLTDVVIETELTTAWSPVTVGHLCYFVNGMLSMPGGVGGLFNIFEVDPETMTYDYEQLEKDIETYGLYTYEELNAICPLSEEMFNAAGGAYLKISIGKGNLTIDELIYMINRYSKFI